MMKSAISFFLLTIFLFNIAGYVIVFKISQNLIRKEIKREIKMKLNESELQKIVFNKNELSTINWLKIDKEFIYDSELFDIVKTTETATTITYYCINDKQEKQLFADLDEHINQHIATNKTNKKNTFKQYDDSNKISYELKIKIDSNIGKPIERVWLYNYNSESIVLAKNSPPPRL
ncbi:MAG: hypothetical protein J0L87_10130 [Bacteroidetes bacterium]|nr:hypothetical protein [Bacteroidota bacterium]